jgi:hypothetical protein
MAVVKPFRAERYDESKAGPLERLVAPPYDVLSAEQREQYLARSPYNVVHLTLPDDEEQAGRDVTAWREQGVLARDQEPGYWLLSQDYVGPDGVSRTRTGLVASLRAEPYENGVVSRTSARTVGRKRPAPAAPRPPHGARADLPALRGGSTPAACARARSPERRGQALAYRDAPNFESTEL